MGHKDPEPSTPSCWLCNTNMAEEASDLLTELSNPERLMIITLLHEKGELHVNEIVELLGANRPSLSRHLGRLREQCLVTTRRKHNRVYYTLDKTKSDHLIRVLSSVMS
ncbi:MAG: metalloregulator ArsR/SmtB family transcription factor [Magnetovibrio sp.]|nr:metalloregulator ArsR/SmtB family transcription factor [Magnetovibrio sp.]